MQVNTMKRFFRNTNKLYMKIPESKKGIFEFLANVFAVFTAIGGLAYSGIKIVLE